MPEVQLDTKELEKMVDIATRNAIAKELKSFHQLSHDVADIKAALLGSDYNHQGMIYKVDTMWRDYLIAKWVMGFVGATTLAQLIGLFVIIKEVFFS